MKKRLEVIDVNGQGNKEKRDITMEEKRRRRQRERARQLAIKRRRRRRIIRLCMASILMLFLAITASRIDFSDKVDDVSGGNVGIADAEAGVKDKEKNPVQEFFYESEFEEFLSENKPKVLEEAEVYKRLSEMAEEYEAIREIYEACDEYPVKLLVSLCNNPEMYEYVKDYPAYVNGDTTVAGKAELTEEEKTQKYPLFLQWDKRWGYEAYGDFNIALSGCGPTTLAMAAVALTEDDTITPDKVAKYSMENGYYVEGTGTAWGLMTEGCEEFGIKANELALDENVMKNQLDNGKVIICSMRPGDFTAVGHFVMIYGYDDTGFYINDANCIYRSSRTWSFKELKNQIRILWAFEEK